MKGSMGTMQGSGSRLMQEPGGPRSARRTQQAAPRPGAGAEVQASKSAAWPLCHRTPSHGTDFLGFQ